MRKIVTLERYQNIDLVFRTPHHDGRRTKILLEKKGYKKNIK